MAYDRALISSILRQMEHRHDQYEAEAESRRYQLTAAIPRLGEIDRELRSTAAKAMRIAFESNNTAAEIETLKQKNLALQAEKQKLLLQNGYPADYLSPIYTCPDCKDTGYMDGEKCHCLKQAIIDTIYTQSNVKNILERENFSVFSYDYYSDTQKDPKTGLTSLETAKRAVAECERFIADFGTTSQNLLFYGNTGVGKTFFTNCIAKELLEKSYSVIYFTAFQLFDILSKGVFEKDADAIAAHQNIFDCDLLIIDDLGTELSNAFTVSQLFLCVNERILREKSTIISTNLNLVELRDLYSERTFSRISNNYNIIKLFGDDIRIQKRKLHQ